MSKNLLELISNLKSTSPLFMKKGRFCVDEITGIALSVSSFYQKNPQNVLVCACNLYNAQSISSFMSDLIGEENVLLFPSDELVRVDELAASKEFISSRLFCLGEILKGNPKVVVAHPASLLRYLPDVEEFKTCITKLSVGSTIEINDLRAILSRAGYSRVNKIDQSLQFASRGDIFDIFSVNYDRPIRIEFFDNEIESIKFFDIATQLSDKDCILKSIEIYPASDQIFTEQEITDLRIDLNRQIDDDMEFYGAKYDELKSIVAEDIDRISEKNFSSKTYKYFSYAKKKTSSIYDYLGKGTLTVIANAEQFKTSSNMIFEESARYFMDLVKEGKLPARLSQYRNPDYVETHFSHIVYGDNLICEVNEPNFITRPIVYTGKSVSDSKSTIVSYCEHSDKVIICLNSPQQMKLVEDLLKEIDVKYDVSDDFDLPKHKVSIMIKELQEGFEIPELNVSVLTAKELFGQIYKNAHYSSKFKEATILKSYQELNPGDYVVHEYKGIGQFVKVETMVVDGINRDYLKIKYSGTDELYVPLSQFKLVRKYAGREGNVPKLNSLSGNEWKKTKAKIKDRVNQLAEKLLKLYSERITVQGFAFPQDDEFQNLFEKEFPYPLTDDQAKSLQEIKEDMMAPYPMDRLLCGDVGFGKTEVAFRAAFKAIAAGKQVALLCPTTLLARQHFEVAKSRFENFGISIGILSRLTPSKEQTKYINQLKEGKLDLIIGTHRLLAKEIVFKDLGFLIVDEEQRFGVEQKERIKELKSNIDVLSLSATPIPRTLQMSLVGLRSYSQINTAPGYRMPIQTYVVEQNIQITKELIDRELARRGQVFYLYNRVSDIHVIANRIARMCKGANVGVVNGQMNRDEIEDIMIKFYKNDINVLVCTSIIENGIDVPNANLIIVENAENFGLSQLYQIKGRVGRGDRIAYAYLMYRPQKVVNNDNARKRLKAIQEFTELGSGYKIAQRDLMIRGAGDILGPQQAGYIDAVGIELYMKMLQDAINGRKTEIEDTQPTKMLTINAFIPQNYAKDPDKIELYQEIENSKTLKEVNVVRDKIRDIYGELPEEVKSLIFKRKIDILYESGAFDNMVEYGAFIELTLSDGFASIGGIGTKLFNELTEYLKVIKVTYIKHVLKIRVQKTSDWCRNLEKIMSIIVKLYFLKIKH